MVCANPTPPVIRVVRVDPPSPHPAAPERSFGKLTPFPTFTMAELVVLVPQGFVNTARYNFPLSVFPGVNVKDALAVPEAYEVVGVPGAVVHVAPLSALTCHVIEEGFT